MTVTEEAPAPEPAALSLRGCPYDHAGPCDGDACSLCYKYRCLSCGERSNLLMTCLFCAARPPSGASLASDSTVAELQGPPQARG
jgi:hypothetical protein